MQEIGVFEISEEAEIHDKTKRHQGEPFPVDFGMIDPIGQKVIDHGGTDQNEEIDATGLIIEVERKERDKCELRPVSGTEIVIDGQESQKQEKEEAAVEDQGLRRMIGELIEQFMDVDTEHIRQIPS